jgi:hypothetical protein
MVASQPPCGGRSGPRSSVLMSLADGPAVVSLCVRSEKNGWSGIPRTITVVTVHAAPFVPPPSDGCSFVCVFHLAEVDPRRIDGLCLLSKGQF